MEYIQIGVTALRTPTGDFLPATPIYIKTSEAIKASGMTQSEENVIHDVARVFAIKSFEMQAKKEAMKCRK
jgi:hypothetical protein